MAHSRVFQLEVVPFNEFEDYDISTLYESSIDENSFPDPSRIDYWSDSTSTREEDFDWLVSVLPEGMFEVNKENLSFTYKECPNEYIEKFVNDIKEEVAKVSLESITTDPCPLWGLNKLLRNNGNEELIYEDGYGMRCLYEWIFETARDIEIGTTFYFGTALNIKL